jgi:uncharacterized protein (DUF1778 family)
MGAVRRGKPSPPYDFPHTKRISNVQTERIAVYLTEEELEVIAKAAEESGESLSDFVRRAVVERLEREKI